MSTAAFRDRCDYGHFDLPSREYVITARRTPRPWLNYLWNREFLSMVSHTGQGYGFHQDSKSLRTSIVVGRRVYVQDLETGETWSAEGMDADREPDAFECRHGLGYTIITQRRGELTTRLRVFVPDEINAESWTLSIENAGEQPRRLRVVAAMDSRVDGEVGFQLYYTCAGSWYDPAAAAIVHCTPTFEDGYPRRAFFSTTSEVSGYDCRHDSFYGPYTRDVLPQGLRDRHLANHPRCDAEKSAFALETRVSLSPGGAESIQFFAGHYREAAEVADVRRRFADPAVIEAAFDRVRRRGVSFPQMLQLQGVDPLFDAWFNTWLLQQVAYNATWARDYFNGYRDLCQDVENVVILDPAWARTKLRQILSFQYPTGFAPRAWMNGKALDHGHGDSPVWITYAVRALVLETGDVSLLNEIVPYYEKDEGTVYDHCRRAMDWYWKDRGENGLCLFRKGDWNDAMIRVGWHGKGTSVWTSMAYHRALNEFAELARMLGRDDDARVAEQRAAEMRRIINEVGWDGDHYIYGFTDAGEPVGSNRNKEGTLHINPQCWAVISGVADAERAWRVMSVVDQFLDGPTGVLSIRDPYSKPDINIGPITGQRPGVYQNQSVYAHSNTFKITADCMLGRAEQAWRSIEKILSFSADRRLTWGEPYVLNNCYFGPAAGYRHDHPGQSWMTATAGWMLRILVQRVFGLMPTLQGLRVNPCLPEKLRDVSITRVFRGATYHVRYERTGGTPSIAVDGKSLEGNLLPHRPGGSFSVLVRW